MTLPSATAVVRVATLSTPHHRFRHLPFGIALAFQNLMDTIQQDQCANREYRREASKYFIAMDYK